MHELARVLAKLFGGHYIGEDYKRWLLDKDFLNAYRALSPTNHFSMDRKFALREFVRATKGLDGSVAECGTYTGASAWFLSQELHGSTLYLFDSFRGLSCPLTQDQSPKGVQQWSEGQLKASKKELSALLGDRPEIKIMEGWIPTRFPEVSSERFRFVHIDVDLYQPTLDSLEFFYPRMNPGGIIVLDDYGFENCPGAFQAAERFMALKYESIIHLPTGQGVIIRSFSEPTTEFE